MCDIINRFSINCHSSIRCDNGNMVLRFDPFRVEDAPHDARLVFITHDHCDHFSPEDIRRVLSPDGFIVLPDTCYRTALEAGFEESALLPVHTGVTYELLGLSFRAVAAYNEGKNFHPEANRWLGYVVTTADGLRFYVAGWTDPEVKAGLGARFTFTRHLVWVRNPILRRILYMFRHWFESDAKAVGAKAADKDTDHA